MRTIPVTFDFEGKEYTGFLSAVSGSGGDVYHLMINNRYMGQLIRTELYGWQFHSQSGKGKDLSEYFGKVVDEADVIFKKSQLPDPLHIRAAQREWHK